MQRSLLAAAATLLAATGVSFAQSASTGAITGRVTDVASKQPLAGVTVVAQGPQGDQADLTDETGSYTITNLAPGMYIVRFYYGNAHFERTNVQVVANSKFVVDAKISQEPTTVYKIDDTHVAPIDRSSTALGTHIDRDFTQNVPVGRGVENVTSVAPGAIKDPMGTGFAGAPAAENNYIIDTVNVTSVHMSQAAGGALGSGLNLDFVQEVEVITGGYNAEYGRATGGIVNVITKSGSNEFHGDAAMYDDPGLLHGQAPLVSFPGQSIATEPARVGGDYRLDFFADLGGPIIKDRLWFYLGVEPIFVRTTQTRIVSALVDHCTQSDAAQRSACTGGPDGVQDFIGGVYQTRELYQSDLQGSASEVQWAGKLNLLVTPDHTLELAWYGSPSTTDGVRVQGTPLPFENLGGSQDMIGRWVSKLFDKKWQLEASLSYHRERLEHQYVDPVENQPSTTWTTDPVADTLQHTDRQGAGPSLSWFSNLEGSHGQTILDNCDTVTFNQRGAPQSVNPTDPNSKLHIVCPVTGYTTGGPGSWEDLLASRVGGRVAGTHFFRALGHHVVMYGWDFERNEFQDTRLWPGGGALNVFQDGLSKYIDQRGWSYAIDQSMGATGKNVAPYPVKRDANWNPIMGANGQPVPDFSQCADPGDIPSNASVFCADTQTLNHALFLRDSWNILPNLTLNLGVRWERQAISGITDWENKILGDSPLTLDNNWSPRIGVIYDPTNEGKAKVYGSFARFYESIPLDINNRSFGAEGYYSNIYRYFDSSSQPTSCKGGLISGQGFNCPLLEPRVFGGEKSLIEPDIQGMYTDELTVGGEYEILEDLAVGGYYTHRQLGTIIEDGSVDNANTYYITNPGEAASQSQINTLVARSQAARNESMRQMQNGNLILANDYNHLASELATFADDLPYFGKFEKPQRDYDAITVTARKRFSKNWLMQASYTYARTIGNYPGIYNPYIDQRDPNISQMYDLPDLLTNRVGPLPTDIPHQFKIDGYYTFHIGGNDALVTGASLRAQSGPPRNVLGVNQIYQPFPENFLLPSGSGGRNDFQTNLDVQLAWVRQLPKNTQLQIFFAAYNVLDSEAAIARNDVYSFDFTTPVVNGRMSDLDHLKTVGGAIAKPNASFGSPTGYQAPIFTRFGARFTF